MNPPNRNSAEGGRDVKDDSTSAGACPVDRQPITPEQRQQWRELEAKATPGPWYADVDRFSDEEGRVICISDDAVTFLAKIDFDQSIVASQSQEMNDARFLAAARSALPALLDENDALRDEVARFVVCGEGGNFCSEACRLRDENERLKAALEEACDWAEGRGDKRREYGLRLADEARINELRKAGGK